MTLNQAITQGAILCALFFLMAAFGVLGSVRFTPGIAAYAIGSLLLGGYAVGIALETGYAHLWVVAGLTVIFKALAIPWLLTRLVRRLKTQSEGRPNVGIPMSLLLGGVLTVIGYTASKRFLPGLHAPYHSGLEAGLTVTLIGMMLIALRRQAIMQLLGLLLCENGTLMIGLAIAPNLPLVVEFGILLDVVVAVVIFSQLVLYLHEVVSTTDTTGLRRLRG